MGCPWSAPYGIGGCNGRLCTEGVVLKDVRDNVWSDLRKDFLPHDDGSDVVWGNASLFMLRVCSRSTALLALGLTRFDGRRPRRPGSHHLATRRPTSTAIDRTMSRTPGAWMRLLRTLG